jgi:hypothetical protein
VLSLSLVVEAVALLATPYITTEAWLHVAFAVAGLTCAVLDTGVQITLRSMHGA